MILVVVLSPFLVAAGLLGWIFYGFSHSSVERYDKPMTLAEAEQKNLNFPFPSSAHDICYAFAGDGFQYYILFVRFSASREDCAKEFSVVSVQKSQELRHKVANTPVNLDQVDPVSQNELAPLVWFKPEMIVHGLTGGANHSQEPTMWFDQDKNIFYYYQTD